MPTRITERSATLLDNFFINCTNNIYQSHAIFDDISDHLPVLLTINIQNYNKSLATNLNDRPLNSYMFNDHNYALFQNAIANENWSFFSSNNLTELSPNESYNLFFSKFKNIFDRSFLHSNRNGVGFRSQKKKRDVPWMTFNLIKSCRKKSRLLTIYKKTGSFMARNNYVTYKNILKQILRQEEKNYYEKLFDQKSNDIKKTWKLINSLLNKTTIDSKSNFFKIDGVLTNNKSTIVDSFNKYFSEIGPSLAQNIPSTNTGSSLCNNIEFLKGSMALIPTDCYEVESVIRNIKTSASCGVDMVPIAAIKCVSKTLAPILATLINHSFSKGIFPDALKISKITPILKMGDKSLLSNYRPISLLNSFSKVYEKIFLIKLNSFLSKHNILYEGQ